jgi:hypothetical protein
VTVPGAHLAHEVDEHRPAAGTQIPYAAGIGPITLDDVTTVRRIEPKRELKLEANAGWLGSARFAFDLRPWGENTLLIIDEHTLSGPGAR